MIRKWIQFAVDSARSRRLEADAKAIDRAAEAFETAARRALVDFAEHQRRAADAARAVPVHPGGTPACCPVCQSPALEPAGDERGPRHAVMAYPTASGCVNVPIGDVYGCTSCRITLVVPYQGQPYRLGEQLAKRPDANEQRIEDGMQSLRGDPSLRRAIANAHRPPSPT